MKRVELKQSDPGSWSHIDILVDGTKRFHASKQGTNFWVIVDADDRHVVIGHGYGRTEVKSVVKHFLSNHSK